MSPLFCGFPDRLRTNQCLQSSVLKKQRRNTQWCAAKCLIAGPQDTQKSQDSSEPLPFSTVQMLPPGRWWGRRTRTWKGLRWPRGCGAATRAKRAAPHLTSGSLSYRSCNSRGQEWCPGGKNGVLDISEAPPPPRACAVAGQRARVRGNEMRRQLPWATEPRRTAAAGALGRASFSQNLGLFRTKDTVGTVPSAIARVTAKEKMPAFQNRTWVPRMQS